MVSLTQILSLHMNGDLDIEKAELKENTGLNLQHFGLRWFALYQLSKSGRNVFS